MELLKLILTMPTHTWFIILILLFCVGIFTLNVLRTKDLVIGKLSLTEKEQVKADASALEDNQIRHGRVHILSISQLITSIAKRKFTDVTPLELAYIKLLSDTIAQSLLNQYRMDLLRNHFTNLTSEQLKIYVKEKADNYYMYVKTYLNDFNECIPRLDFMKIMDDMNEEKFEDVYFKAYTSARNLTIGY